MSSGIMQHPLATCLLATCIALGVSLECEECIGIGRNCHGSTITCHPDKDSCGIATTENMGHKGILKSCISSKACGKGLASLNMGRVGTSRTNIVCCTGDDCRKEAPPMPPRNTTLNGKKCPACYSMNSECKEEMTACAGAENYCFEMSGSTTMGALEIKIAMKGCANEAACYDIRNADASIAGINLVQSARCTSGAASNMPAIVGFLFPVLASLLFGEFFV